MAKKLTFDAWRIHAEDTATAAGFTVGHWTDVENSGDDWGVCAVSGLFEMRCTVQLMVHKPD